MPGEPFDRIVNTSILQTMTRSFNTLATVVIMLVALLAFGGASLQNFAFALLVGICSGGYHSIFYSAPLVAVMRERQLRDAKRRRDKGRIAPSARGPSPRRARKRARPRRAKRSSQARRERRDRKKTRCATLGWAGALPPQARTGTEPGVTAVADDYEYENETEGEFEEMDPLDAQNAGVHDAQLELGHEEIKLEPRTTEETTAHPPDGADQHGTTPPKQ